MKRILSPFFYLMNVTLLFSQADFTGKPGIYFLGAAGMPVSNADFTNPDISGVVVRFRWEDVEASPGNFTWTFIDAERAKAVLHNKKISLQPLGAPDWLGTLNAQKYYYIDENVNHSTYGQIVSGFITWDPVYIDRVKNFLYNLSLKYAGDTVVSYVNAVSGQMSRNLPDTVVTDTTNKIKQSFWTAFPYKADTLAKKINAVTDHYMALFPSTPLWNSVDYVKFEPNATGKPINYLCSLYTAYGLANYPDRYGLFREDLSGCNPSTSISSGSHWHMMKQNPCRTGAQMLWSVQDGPNRMNKCGITPNSEQVVLDSAVGNGLRLGMRYLEIYGADIQDASLSSSISLANAKLIAKALECKTASGQEEEGKARWLIYPNPAKEKILIQNEFVFGNISVQLYNLSGKEVYFSLHEGGNAEIDISGFSKGLYCVRGFDAAGGFSRNILIID